VNKTSSFFWFDYETFGTQPAWDRPCQFAGIRTDENLNVIGEPLVIYCRQSDDYLPQPAAAKVTGITPQLANSEGLSEADFIERIRREMTFPGTCSVGYNNIRFDDEFTRHTLFRNLSDAYEQEWKDGCSRWDLLDIVRLTRALRPDGIQWPVHEDGSSSNRLEHLSVANGIEHSQAHDAMSDVWATIGMAKLIKQMQPKLFDYAFAHRSKQAVSEMLNFNNRKPCLQVSGMIPATQHHISAVLPLCRHPKNNNGVIVLDLSHDAAYLNELDAEEIAARLFCKSDTEQPDPRPGLRTIHINKCPVLVPLNTLRAEDAERLTINTALIKQREEAVSRWLDNQTLNNITTAMTPDWPNDENLDVDGTLYSGSFLSQDDKKRLSSIKNAAPQTLSTDTHGSHFDDPRLDTLFFRYLARNYPSQLSGEERALWQDHCLEKLTTPGKEWLDFNTFEALLNESDHWQESEEPLREALRQYGQELRHILGA